MQPFIEFVEEYLRLKHVTHDLTRSEIVKLARDYLLELREHVVWYVNQTENDCKTVDRDNEDLFTELFFDETGLFNFGARIDLDIYLNYLLDEFTSGFFDHYTGCNIPHILEESNESDGESGLLNMLQDITSLIDDRLRRAFMIEDETNAAQDRIKREMEVNSLPVVVS